MDVATIRIVIIALGVICGVCLFGIVYLSGGPKEPPVSLTITLSTAVGALVGIIATPSRPPLDP